MEKKIWYGYSKQANRVQFFDTDPSGHSELVGTGTFLIEGNVKELKIENVQASSTTRQPA